MMTFPPRILIIGYGNPGRMDDGLGPMLADAIEMLHLPHVTVESNYQLTLEDAALAAPYDVVIFADASKEGEGAFSFQEVQPVSGMEFTSHSVSPSAVLGLTRDLFNAQTRGYMLGIRGVAFDGFGEFISERARNNLHSALDFLHHILTSGDFNDTVLFAGEAPSCGTENS